MKKRSIVALMLAVVMLVTMFSAAGCGKKQEPTTTEQTTTQPAQTSQQTGEQPSVKEREVIELKTTTSDFVEFDETKDEIAKYIYETFKIKFIPQPTEVGQEQQQVMLWAASDSLPDVLEGNLHWWGVRRWQEFIDSGYIRPVPDEMINKFPRIKEMTDSYVYADVVRKLKGQLYGIPKPNQSKNIYETDWVAIYYRKDWMNNVGITKVPETLDEFYEMIKKFAHEDPDRNGKNDTYGITAPGLGTLNWFFGGYFGIAGGWVWDKESGKWTRADFSDEYIPLLEWYQKIYKEGILDPEFSMLGALQAIQRFASNISGTLVRNADVHWVNRTILQEFGGANPDAGDPYELVGTIPALLVEGKTPKREANAPHQFIEFNAKTMDDEKLERYLEFHEWLLSDEGIRLMRLGFENKHWKFDEQGRIVTMNDPETGQPYEVWKIYPAATLYQLSSWGFDLNIDMNWPTPGIDRRAKEITLQNIEIWKKYKYVPDFRTTVIQTQAQETYKLDTTTDWTNIIMGDKPAAEAFKQWVQDQLQKGGQAWIDEFNAEAQKLGIVGE